MEGGQAVAIRHIPGLQRECVCWALSVCTTTGMEIAHTWAVVLISLRRVSSFPTLVAWVQEKGSFRCTVTPESKESEKMENVSLDFVCVCVFVLFACFSSFRVSYPHGAQYRSVKRFSSQRELAVVFNEVIKIIIISVT